MGPPSGIPPLQEYGRALYDAACGGGDVVFDRLHVGERVYGPTLRGVDLLGRGGEVLIHRLLTAYGARLVFCLPPYSVAFENWLERHQGGAELIKKSQTYEQVYYAYKALSNDLFYADSVWWDYTLQPMELAAKTLLTFDAKRPRCPEGVVGSPNPQFLFVGEQANQEYLDIPFFALDNSSHFLNSCIKDAGFQERDIALVNAKALDGAKAPLGAIYMALREPKVIALGSHASHALKAQGVTHHKLPHPSYWKRFHSSRPDEYVRQLREIRINSYHVQRA
jgi:hypothetical protein